MAVHDTFARLTPYELTFADPGSAGEHCDAIREEADARAVDARDPGSFVLLAATGQALRAVRGPEDDAALIHQHGLLLYHAFHFRAHGEPLWLVRAPALRELVDGPPPPHAAGLPGEAGYVQLPQHLVWVRPDEQEPPESLDGFHWTRSGDDRFELLLALGVRGDRPGLSVVPLSELPAGEASGWARADMRPGGGDFSSSLPGAELEGLYELRSAGEALKLAARVLERLGRGPAPEATAPPAAGTGPRPSALPYRVVDATAAGSG